ncbi:MAG: M48 family metallopeptidase [Anaerolineae bacterium]|nr:M48 family metallopeptidase [Anaerolineae bacterium]
MVEEPRMFPGLSPAAFQHPLDIQATASLRNVPLLAPLLTAISSSLFERQMRLASIANTVRLGPNQGGSLYRKFERAADILDLPDLPEIYVSNQYVINAYAFGIEKYQITLFSGLIDALTEDELMAVIGHELGHVKCEHMLYKTMAYILRIFGVEFLRTLLPANTGTLASIPLQLAILHWERMAELSCDRAGLLVVQDREVVASALSKLAGGSRKLLPEINLDQVLKQADEYEDSSGGLLEQMFKVNMLLLQTHPFPIVRTKEIMNWGLSEQYQNILNGNYAHFDGVPILAAVEPISKVCPHCDQRANASAATCPACARSMKGGRSVCTACGIKVFSSWQKCPGCGARLQKEADETVAA